MSLIAGSKGNLCFYGGFQDKEYLPILKSCVKGATCYIKLDKVNTLLEVSYYCKTKNITGIISTSPQFLAKLLEKQGYNNSSKPSISNYAGSVFHIKDKDGKYVEVVFVNPLKQAVTIPYGKFMLKRYISKLVSRANWIDEIDFNWSMLDAANFDMAFAFLSASFLVSIDIETFRDNARIRCVSFAGFQQYKEGKITSHSYVFPIDSEYNLAILQKLCWEVKAPKVFQNGKYDINYLLRYNCIVYNYIYDTATFFHAWYSELPKDLGFLNSFFIRDSMYWKDLSQTQDLQEYYRYNCLDTWGTGICFIAMMLEAPQWAIDNYRLEFPTLAPCILAEMTGIERDMERLGTVQKEIQAKDEAEVRSLRACIDEPFFNPGSSKQVVQLLKVLGCKDITSSDEKSITKAKYRHPLNGRILGYIAKSRKLRKMLTTYLTVGDKAKEFHRPDGTGNRILFALNPHGTDTSRLASREHHFWCGLQAQNIPRDKTVKSTLKADPGFYLAEVDLEQAESRDTAYISSDEILIDAVENSPDFHSSNASKFFGVPLEEIYDTTTSKTLNKPLRQLAKPINHGANYNMGEFVLLETMGEQKVLEAKKLLNLPVVWSLKEVTRHLLEQFHKTYRKIKSVMYAGIVTEITTTSRLKSQAVHYSIDIENHGANLRKNPAWIRYCFGNPNKSKSTLNTYIAHPPQALNAQTLNKAWIKVFYTIAINPKYSDNFKLIAQIHDSILFQYRIGHEYLCQMVVDCMEIPVTIKAYDGKVRAFTVPAGIKAGTPDKPAIYWSETE